MSMSESMNDSEPCSDEQHAFIFLAILAVVLGCFAMVSLIFRIAAKRRLRAAKNGSRAPARSSQWYTLISLCRECVYGQISLPTGGRAPNNGITLICIMYTALLMSCLFIGMDIREPTSWEIIAMRAGYLCIAQCTLLVALSTKINLIAICIGSSPERLVVYHRLVGFHVAITATTHMAFFTHEWLYFQVWTSQWAEMGLSMLCWGYAAWGLLILLIFTSITLIRNRMYDWWLVIHVVCMCAFFAMLILHVDQPYRPWAIVPLAIWGTDRLCRFALRIKINSTISQGIRQKYHATLQSLPGDVCKVKITNHDFKYSPGQYIQLTILELGLHSHPFTILSSPDSAELVLLIKVKSGFTLRANTRANHDLSGAVRLPCSIEGPYGASHTPLQAFDTVLLIAGGVGVSFTTSLLQNLVTEPGCCRLVRFIWVVKEEAQVTWLADTLTDCIHSAQAISLNLEIQIYITGKVVPLDCVRENEKRSEPYPGHVRRGKPDLRCLRDAHNGNVTVKPVARCSTNTNDSIQEGNDTNKPSEGLRLRLGRPDVYALVSTITNGTLGESGIAACGPLSMTSSIRNVVVQISDERAVKKGTGAEAISLHIEEQS